MVKLLINLSAIISRITRASFICIILIMPFSSANPQSYGNEWINYEQPYFRFKVYSDGIYRLYYSTLDSALSQVGINIGNINHQHFQVWGRGEQQFIFIRTGSDNIFNTGDYIEFYGRRNDGYFDSLLYNSPADVLNPYISIFSDTAYYFFSFNSSSNNCRMTNEYYPNYIQFTPLAYVWATQNSVFYNYYATGRRYVTSDPSTTIADAAYTPGEGYTGERFYPSWSNSKPLTAPDLYLQGPSASLSFGATGGCNRVTQTKTVHLKTTIGSTVILDSIFPNYSVRKFQFTFPSNQFLSNNNTIVFAHIPVSGQNLHEWISVPYISIKYARQLSFSNSNDAWFRTPEIFTSGFHYLKVSNINVAANDTLRLYDLSHHRRIRMVESFGFFHGLLPDLPGEEDCYLSPDNTFNRVKSLKPVGNRTGFFPDLTDNQVLAEVDYLMISHDSLMAEAGEYAEYRRNEGYPEKYTPLLLNIEDVYDQFAHGIDKNPLSIRNFARFALENFPKRPEYLFLVGKSYCPDNYRFNAQSYKSTLVPVFGSPPSDWMFTSGLEHTDSIAFAVGRLSAAEKDDVKAYLQKVREFEEAQSVPSSGQKNVLNFGGGSNYFQQSVFSYYLSLYAEKIRNPFFGGNVRTFLKTSPEPIQINQSEQLHKIIEDEGISVLNYFGHASGVSFDMSIGDPADFDNRGKYYFVLANSCWAGDIFNYHNGLSSERYVLLPQKGAIAYLASVTEGEHYYLHSYSNAFYDGLCNSNYGKPLGQIAKATMERLMTDTILVSFSYREVSLEFCLHGDPALVLNSPSYPDYDITPSVTTPQRVFFSPANITTELDSFQLILIPGNNGKALDTMFFVRIERIVENIEIMDTLIRVKAPYFNDTIIINLPVLKQSGGIENTFRICLDALVEIDENGLTANNTIEKTLNIRSSAIVPVWPYDYAIVPQLPLNLKASTSFALEPVRSYAFQLDTTDSFNSPVLQQSIITQPGGLISWTPDFPIQSDSIVYYWRCTLYDGQADTSQWKLSSFQYISGKSGWSQAHFFQFEKNDYQYVKFVRDSLRFSYVQDYKSLFASTYISGHPWQDELFKINGNVMDIWSCAETRCTSSCGLKFAVFDPVSFNCWISQDQGNGLGQYKNKHCRSYPVGSFDFCTYLPEDRQTIVDFIDTIPEGYYILAFSHRNHRAEEYEESVYQAFESFGSQIIRQISDTCPYIIFGRKGLAPGEALETGLFSARDSLVRIDTSIATDWNCGYISSVPIGPALKWNSLHWEVDANINDSVRLRVIGIRHDGSENIIFEGLSDDSLDIYNLDQIISALNYPRLKLVLFLKDTNSLSPGVPQPAMLKRWQVLYDEAPETMVDPSAYFSFHSDSIQQGDSLKLGIAYHNISTAGMDSLLVHYWIESPNGIDTLAKQRLRPHPAGDILNDSFSLSTAIPEGNYTFYAEINPANDQPEYKHFNNYLEIPFVIYPDCINPLLDVTFDGIHIVNGDYVSSSPEIIISLSDENPYLLLADTSLFSIQHGPLTGYLSPLWFRTGNIDQLEFISATASNNTCHAIYRPVYKEDGMYELSVQAKDNSGNLSGQSEYSIQYRVRPKAGMSLLYNYPNPFSDLCWFSFTVTGSKAPTDVSIRIFDPLGRLVKEFGNELFGELHLGTNISRMPWDGSSISGSRLSSGVYPIEVKVSTIDGNLPVDPLIPSGPGRSVVVFKNKIVIMR